MNFKQLMEEDLKALFDPEEMGEIHEFWIDGTRHKGAIIINDEGATDRARSSTDNVPSVHREDMTVHIPLDLIGEVPRKDWSFELANRDYAIIKVREIEGEVVLLLKGMAE